MMIKVFYHSQTGNTAKIAKAIAEAVGVQAEAITKDSTVDRADLLFIGDGIYAGKPSALTLEFIEKLAGCNVRCAAVFGTFGGQQTAITQMKEKLEKQGILVFDETFGSKGKAWLFLNRKHPDAKELEDAKKFAHWALEALEKHQV